MSEGTPHLFLRRGCGGRVRGEKDGCGLKKYFICYFDVLGQRDVLKDISSDSFSMPKEVRVKCQLFNRMSLKIVGEVEKVISSWRKRNCQWHGDAGMVQFSDSFVTFVEDCERGRDLFGEMLIEVGCFYWEMLCKAMPIRGVVAYGEASVVSGGSLCGKVFQEISVYERCLAQYSRLVFVGNKDLYQNLPCTICDGVLSLDIFDHLICKRVGVGGMKVGQLTIAETIAKVQQSPVILHKTIQTLRMLGEGGIARLIAGDQNCWEDEDRISKKDPYPRLRPDDYFVAYLRVDKVLLTGETGLIGISSGDVDDTGKVELVQMLVGHFTKSLCEFCTSLKTTSSDEDKQDLKLSKCMVDIGGEEMEYGVQQIDADVIVWVKDNCLAAPYLLSYVLGEMATIAYRFVSDGYFIRGEVAYGAGWNLYRDSGGACLYGPVIALAYDRLNKGMYALEVRVSERVMVELQSNPLVSRSEGGQNPYFTKYPHNDAYYLNIESRCRRCHHLKFKDGTLRDDSGDVWKRWDESRRMLTDFNEKVVCACNAGEFLTNRDMLSKAVALYDFVNHSKSFLSGGVI